MIRAVIFDLDNTLVDFMRLKYESISAAARGMIDAGLDRDPEAIIQGLYDIYDTEGMEYKGVFDAFLDAVEGNIDPKILSCGIVEYRRARTANLVLYPHVKHTLMTLIRQGYRLAILTDAPRLKAWIRLANLNLQHYFDPVITHDDTGYHKPHPAPFQRILQELALSAEEVIMVGDWPERDIEGARQLGIRTALAAYGSTMDTANHRADHELPDLRSLLTILDTLNEGRRPVDPDRAE